MTTPITTKYADDTVNAQDFMQQYVDDPSSYGSVMPQGAILIWTNPNTIPGGWALCDGSNGTPDLSDRFVVGAGNSNDDNGDATVAGTSGEATVIGLSGAFTFGYSSDHTHPSQHTWHVKYCKTDSNGHHALAIKDLSSLTNFIGETAGGGAHTHEFSNWSDMTLSQDNLTPNWIAVCYIMKL